MNRMLAIGGAVLCLAVVHSAVADALPRGKAGTQTRKDYCQDKYDRCMDDARKDCKVTVPIREDSAYCMLGAGASCDRSWGSKSTCNSEPRIFTDPNLNVAPLLNAQ
jgi:hypothetical protein